MGKQLRSNSNSLRLKCIQSHETFTLTAIILFARSAVAAAGRVHVAPTLRGVNAWRAPRPSARWSRSSRGETSHA
jgi:hypothetical protein